MTNAKTIRTTHKDFLESEILRHVDTKQLSTVLTCVVHAGTKGHDGTINRCFMSLSREKTAFTFTDPLYDDDTSIYEVVLLENLNDYEPTSDYDLEVFSLTSKELFALVRKEALRRRTAASKALKYLYENKTVWIDED